MGPTSRLLKKGPSAGYPSVRMGDGALPFDRLTVPSPACGGIEGHLDLFEQPGQSALFSNVVEVLGL